jgi:hypothetical protein
MLKMGNLKKKWITRINILSIFLPEFLLCVAVHMFTYTLNIVETIQGINYVVFSHRILY